MAISLCRGLNFELATGNKLYEHPAQITVHGEQRDSALTKILRLVSPCTWAQKVPAKRRGASKASLCANRDISVVGPNPQGLPLGI
jgi:hypothetical protein